MYAGSNRYEVFLKTAELGSITKAADALNYTQSGVSHAIVALEKETGFPLFIRSANGVSLTEDGHKIAEAVQRLVNEQRNLSQTISEINHIVAGTIRLGTISSVTAGWLPELMLAFQREYPNVEFELLEGNYYEVSKWLEKRRIDCGFLTSADDSDFFYPLKQDPLLVIMSKANHLADKASLTVDEILGECLIMEDDVYERDVRHSVFKALRPANLKYTLNSDVSVLSLVEKDFGITVFPEMALRYLSFDVAAVPIEPNVYRTIGIASKSLNTVSVAAKAFIKFLKETDLRDFEIRLPQSHWL